MDNKKVFISYLDDNEVAISGYFFLKKKTNTLIEIDTGKNIITLPMNRVLKIKEEK